MHVVQKFLKYKGFYCENVPLFCPLSTQLASSEVTLVTG